MTQEKQYELRIRAIANVIQEGTTFTHVVLDEISVKHEKTTLKKLIHRYNRELEERSLVGFDVSRTEKILKVLNSRSEIVNK